MASHGVPRVAEGDVDKSEQTQKKEWKKVEAYRELVEQVRQQIQQKPYNHETLLLTSKILTTNPEYYTVWNYRRILLSDVFVKALQNPTEGDSEHASRPSDFTPAQQEISLLLKEDLAFLTPLIKQFPKTYWIWNHRAWLLQQSSEHLPVSASIALWQQEFGLVAKMLSADSRNFHAWQYRRKVISSLEELSKENTQKEEATQISMAEQEFEYTTKMIKANLSNFSAWHNRSQLIPRLMDERNATDDQRRQMLDTELDWIAQALYTDPYDQSLWFYHQFLMATLASNAGPRIQIVKNLTNEDRVNYLETQIELIQDMLDGTDDCKWIYQGLLSCAQQYLQIEAGNKVVTTLEMREWLVKLEELDPLRKGRWEDWRKTLDL